MSDMSSMDRERKKKQLRQQVISSQELRNQAEFREDEEESGQKSKKPGKRKWIIILVILGILLAVGLGFYYYWKNYQYTTYTVGWEVNNELRQESGQSSEDVTKVNIDSSQFVEYINFGSNVLKFSKNGASYVDAQGKVVWTEPYEMKSPIAVVNGDFAAIGDKQGNDICIFSTQGLQGRASTVLPITKVAVSAHGVTAALIEDSRSMKVDFFNRDGSGLKIGVESALSKSGYIVDISLSPDGTQLMESYVYLENGQAKSRVTFHNFSELGKNIQNRHVGSFMEGYENSLIARVRFMDETYSCAFANDNIAFYTSKNVLSPDLIKMIPIEEEIRTIFYSDKYAGVIVNSMSQEFSYRMDIYKSNGDLVFSEGFNYPYTHADIDGDQVFLYNENSCQVYNMSGKLKFHGEFDFSISKITNGRFPNTLIVMGPQYMKEIKLR